MLQSKSRNRTDRLVHCRAKEGTKAPYLRDRPAPKQDIATPAVPINGHKQYCGHVMPEPLESFK